MDARSSSRCARGSSRRRAAGDGFFVRPGSLLDHPLALAFPLVDAGPATARRAVGTLPRHGRGAAAAGPGLPARAALPPARGGALRSPRGERVRRGGRAEGRPFRRLLERPRPHGSWPPSPATCSAASPAAAVGPGGDRLRPRRSPARASASDRPTTARAPARRGAQPRTRAPGCSSRGTGAGRWSRPWRASAPAQPRGRLRRPRAPRRHARPSWPPGAQRARRLARQQMEFVAGVTHELNTPLAAIRSAGQNLADGIVTDPAQVRRYGGLIEKEGGRLTALVAQVLDFAGIESGSRAYASEPLSVAAPRRRGPARPPPRARAGRDDGRARRRSGPAGGPGGRGRPPPRPRQPRGERGEVRGEPGGWVAVRASARPDEGHGRGARRGPGPGHPARRARAGLRALLSADRRRSGTRRPAAASA